MVINGHIHDGVVILEGGSSLPEGTPVSVIERVPPVVHTETKKQRVILPLIPSERPGTLDLTGERIAAVLEEQDVSS